MLNVNLEIVVDITGLCFKIVNLTVASEIRDGVNSWC